MQSLTTLGGAMIHFDPAGINTIADHNDTTGEAATCVFGITENGLMIAEPVSDFMRRLGIESGFARLTRGNGWPVWINRTAVSWFREARQSDYYKATVRTLVSVGGRINGVTEAVDQVRAALNGTQAIAGSRGNGG